MQGKSKAGRPTGGDLIYADREYTDELAHGSVEQAPAEQS